MPTWSIATLCCLAACAEWPRFENLPPAPDTGALPAGTDPGSTVDISWSGPLDATENGADNGLPIDDQVRLGPDEGVLLQGSFQGMGWTDTPSEATGSCGPLAFPLTADGNYLGDVDWVGVDAQVDGFLCATLEVDAIGVQLDLLAFDLNPCGEPDSVRADDAGSPYGYDAVGPVVEWALPVRGGDQLGVALAPFWPQDLSLEADWTLALSIVQAGVCPDPPEGG